MTDHITRTVRGFSLPAVIATSLVVCVFLSAGFWQLHRADHKDKLKTLAESAMNDLPVEFPKTVAASSADFEFHAVHVLGEWRGDKTIFLDNKIREGHVGYEVVTPLRLSGTENYVLVNRGWVAASAIRSELPKIETPPTPVDFSGIARAPSNRFLELSKSVEQGQVWQNLTIERFRSWSGLMLQPTLVYQQTNNTEPLKPVPVAPEASGLGADRHRGYALTWFGLAIVTSVLALAANTKAKNHAPKD